MSLLGTLAKVAVGVVIAKSVSGMLQKRQGGGAVLPDGRFGGAHSSGGRTTGLEDMMGDIFGKDTAGRGGGLGKPAQDRAQDDPFGQDPGPVVANEPASTGGGGLGDLLEKLGGGSAGRSAGGTGMGGGLGDLLGQLSKGGSGGLGDLLGGLVAGATGGGAAGGSATAATGTKSFGDALNEAFGTGGTTRVAPTPEHEAAAGLLLRAMIQAAKSDGRIDAAERKKLTDNLGDATSAEMRFVQAELQAPIDVPGLCRQVPEGLAPQVYAMSVMAIDLDNRTEAEYLNKLANGLGLDRAAVNDIHNQMGVTPLYS